jgi:hypothetical protein
VSCSPHNVPSSCLTDIPNPFSFDLPLTSKIEKDDGSSVTIRCKITNEDEWNTWFNEYKLKSTTTWIVRSSAPKSKNNIFSKDFVCHHHTFNKSGNSRKNFKCPATLTVRIKAASKWKRFRDIYAKVSLF